MEVRRRRPQSRSGPEDWFTGEVWMDEIGWAPKPSRVQVLSVHFAPGARTAWHTHPVGQVLHVTEGEGRVQLQGELVQEIRAGDTVLVEAGEVHWHGASPGSFMTHIAVQEADADGVPTHWGEHVSDEEYLADPV
jgi:quercetin dioxygenase-like cupin family protein